VGKEKGRRRKEKGGERRKEKGIVKGGKEERRKMKSKPFVEWARGERQSRQKE
jgi:hypothetical protein